MRRDAKTDWSALHLHKIAEMQGEIVNIIDVMCTFRNRLSEMARSNIGKVMLSYMPTNDDAGCHMMQNLPSKHKDILCEKDNLHVLLTHALQHDMPKMVRLLREQFGGAAEDAKELLRFAMDQDLREATIQELLNYGIARDDALENIVERIFNHNLGLVPERLNFIRKAFDIQPEEIRNALLQASKDPKLIPYGGIFYSMWVRLYWNPNALDEMCDLGMTLDDVLRQSAVIQIVKHAADGGKALQYMHEHMGLTRSHIREFFGDDFFVDSICCGNAETVRVLRSIGITGADVIRKDRNCILREVAKRHLHSLLHSHLFSLSKKKKYRDTIREVFLSFDTTESEALDVLKMGIKTISRYLHRHRAFRYRDGLLADILGRINSSKGALKYARLSAPRDFLKGAPEMGHPHRRVQRDRI